MGLCQRSSAPMTSITASFGMRTGRENVRRSALRAPAVSNAAGHAGSRSRYRIGKLAARGANSPSSWSAAPPDVCHDVAHVVTPALPLRQTPSCAVGRNAFTFRLFAPRKADAVARGFGHAVESGDAAAFAAVSDVLDTVKLKRSPPRSCRSCGPCRAGIRNAWAASSMTFRRPCFSANAYAVQIDRVARVVITPT